MHIVLAILGALGAIGVIVWRISMAIQGARVIGEAAGEVANLPRKMRFRSKANRKGLSGVDDPQEAAAILLLGMARCGGEVTLEEKSTIRAEMARRFETSEEQAEELLARAAWISASLHNPEDGITRMTNVIAQRLSARELGELAAMMEVVAHAGGNPTPAQNAYLAQYRRRAGLV
tara:strand:+ start:401 stop:928 length:528 start_codon:yes stop_codon:yes gene_type:complete